MRCLRYWRIQRRRRIGAQVRAIIAEMRQELREIGVRPPERDIDVVVVWEQLAERIGLVERE